MYVGGANGWESDPPPNDGGDGNNGGGDNGDGNCCPVSLCFPWDSLPSLFCAHTIAFTCFISTGTPVGGPFRLAKAITTVKMGFNKVPKS